MTAVSWDTVYAPLVAGSMNRYLPLPQFFSIPCSTVQNWLWLAAGAARVTVPLVSVRRVPSEAVRVYLPD